MKHIGIAAITAVGAALVYKQICLRAMQRTGSYRHPEISLHSFSFSEHLQPDEAHRREQWAELMTQSALKLHGAGADFMICPSNSPHDVYDAVAPSLPLPWLHIVSAACGQARSMRVTRALLLGTHFTLESRMYDEPFSRDGIEIVRPSGQETAQVHQCITRELIHDRASHTAKAFFAELIEKYARRDVDAVILGCTELPLVIDTQRCRLPVIDTTAALADAAVAHALDAGAPDDTAHTP